VKPEDAEKLQRDLPKWLADLLVYSNGRTTRDLSRGEVAGFVVLVFVLGGVCVWGLFRFFG
jgi:hypothetical protein